MKKRMLNAGHSALGYLGALAGYRGTDEALADDVFAAYLDRLWDDEVAPLLGDVPGVDLEAYADTLLERFSNPGIADPLTRMCRRGSTKMPDYLLPSVRDARAGGGRYELLALAVAAWLRFLRGTDDAGRPLEVDDPFAPRLQRLARAGGDDPRRVLAEREIFGDLAGDPAFVATVARHLRALSHDGARATIAACLNAADPLLIG